MKNKFTLLHCYIATLLKKYKCDDIVLLIAHAINENKEFVFSHPEYKLSFLEYFKIRYYIYLRKNNYPLAYITKNKEFYGLDFYINKHVLVPRPETEMMVDEVTYNMKHITCNNLLLVDVGTGSSCIPISIIKTLKHGNIKTVAIDISRKALRVAKKNAQHHKVNINFLHGDLLQPIIKNCSMLYDSCSMFITANLPYLTSHQFKTESSIQHEPRQALVADDKDGLLLYEQLLKQVHKIVTCYMLHVTCYLEIDPSQTSQIKLLIKTYLPNTKTIIKKDLSGLDRLVSFYI